MEVPFRKCSMSAGCRLPDATASQACPTRVSDLFVFVVLPSVSCSPELKASSVTQRFGPESGADGGRAARRRVNGSNPNKRKRRQLSMDPPQSATAESTDLYLTGSSIWDESTPPFTCGGASCSGETWASLILKETGDPVMLHLYNSFE